MEWLNINPSDIQDGNLLGLIAELEELVPVSHRQYDTLFIFLTQCLYYNGKVGGRIKLNARQHAPAKGLLETRVSKLQGTAIFEVCNELSLKKHESIEMHDAKQLYVFLNAFLPNYEKTDRERNKRLKHSPRKNFR